VEVEGRGGKGRGGKGPEEEWRGGLPPIGESGSASVEVHFAYILRVAKCRPHTAASLTANDTCSVRISCAIVLAVVLYIKR